MAARSPNATARQRLPNKNRVEVPSRFVTHEGFELAKGFGSTDGHKFVNGVLDKLAPRLREAEVKAFKR